MSIVIKSGFVPQARGGLYRSHDYGASWRLANTGLTIPEISSLLCDSEGYLFAATKSGYLNSNTVNNGGVFVSSDRGQTWWEAKIDSPYTTTLALTQDADGRVYAGVDASGIYRTADHGIHWAKLNIVFPYAPSFISLAVNSRGNIFSGTLTTGLFRYVELNGVWTTASLGFANRPIFAVGIDSNDAIFIGVSGEGIFRSIDNGETWQTMSQTLSDARSILINAQGDIFAGGFGTVYRSQDHGVTWMRFGNEFTEYLVLALALNTDGKLFTGTWGAGVLQNHLNGGTWIPLNEGLSHHNVSELVIDKDGYLFAGTMDGGVFRSVASTLQGNEEPPETPLLSQNYPNPFNATTNIRFFLPQAAFVNLKVYNLLGEVVARLTNQNYAAGEHSLRWNAERFVNGIYILQLKTGSIVQSKKLLLISEFGGF